MAGAFQSKRIRDRTREKPVRDDRPHTQEDNMNEEDKETKEEEESSSQVVFKEVFDDTSEPTDKGES